VTTISTSVHTRICDASGRARHHARALLKAGPERHFEQKVQKMNEG
jgi:hypothetical protein